MARLREEDGVKQGVKRKFTGSDDDREEEGQEGREEEENSTVGQYLDGEQWEREEEDDDDSEEDSDSDSDYSADTLSDIEYDDDPDAVEYDTHSAISFSSSESSSSASSSMEDQESDNDSDSDSDSGTATLTGEPIPTSSPPPIVQSTTTTAITVAAPLGACNQSIAYQTSANLQPCRCLRFARLPNWADSRCGGCGHHASFHALKAKKDGGEEEEEEGDVVMKDVPDTMHIGPRPVDATTVPTAVEVVAEAAREVDAGNAKTKHKSKEKKSLTKAADTIASKLQGYDEYGNWRSSGRANLRECLRQWDERNESIEAIRQHVKGMMEHDVYLGKTLARRFWAMMMREWHEPLLGGEELKYVKDTANGVWQPSGRAKVRKFLRQWDARVAISAAITAGTAALTSHVRYANPNPDEHEVEVIREHMWGMMLRDEYMSPSMSREFLNMMEKHKPDLLDEESLKYVKEKAAHKRKLAQTTRVEGQEGESNGENEKGRRGAKRARLD